MCWGILCSQGVTLVENKTNHLEKRHLCADNILIYLKYHTSQQLIINSNCWMDCMERVTFSISVWLDGNYVAQHHKFHSQKQASFVYRLIHVRYRFTLVYTPGRFGKPHPSPQDTTPAIQTSLSSFFLIAYPQTTTILQSFIYLFIHSFIHSFTHPSICLFEECLLKTNKQFCKNEFNISLFTKILDL